MAQIVNKLNLNRTPQLVDNNSLIFAKNVRLSANGFSPDFGFDKIDNPDLHTDIYSDNVIVGVIPHNTEFYILTHSATGGEDAESDSVNSKEHCILKYDELTGHWTRYLTAWKWSGGKVEGKVTINLNGDVLLTIIEYDTPNNILVPIKVINLTEATPFDDESLYTQAPKVPFINLSCIERYKNVIPAGTYQFFVRYEIRDDFYTNWFPASKELFAGLRKTRLTQQGGLKYTDLTVDSDESFRLKVDRVIEAIGYKSFQLGFILAHDDEVYARAYKHYTLDTEIIDFDYDTEYVEELEVRDLLESPYNLYNVHNITQFRNKAYISNYIESDFNPTINENRYVKTIDIDIAIAQNEVVSDFAGNEMVTEDHNGTSYITGIGGTSLLGTDVQDINTILAYLLTSNKRWINSTSVDDGFSLTRKYRGVKVNFIKELPTKPVPGGGGEVIDDDDDGTTYDYPVGTYIATTQQLSDFEASSTDLVEILTAIANNVKGIRTTDGAFVDSNYNNNITYVIKHLFTVRSGNTFVTKEAIIGITFSVNVSDIHISYELKNEYSLVPRQGYNFYVHFVRDNGEATNGYLINDEPIVIGEPTNYLPNGEDLDNHDMPALYPKFIFNGELPEGFVAWFISILHVSNNVAQIVNVGAGPVEGVTCGDCFELDTRLYTALTNIPVVKGQESALVDYRASYDSEYAPTFGSSGKCVFRNGENDPTFAETPDYAFIELPYENNPKYAQLVRCSPFITPTTIAETDGVYDDYINLNLLGYLCRVKKPLDNYSVYFSGHDFYEKTEEYKALLKAYQIHLDPWDDTNEGWKTYYDSTEYTVYSNFNLNYLSLVNDIIPQVYTKDFGTQENPDRQSFILYATDSINLSEVYELKSMFRSYTRKTYYPFDLNNVLVKFDNTIRSSELQGDEEIVNMFKFRPTDYYNVPTDKGIIINLVAVGDNILVHTQDSIYKFSGNNSLSAAGGEDIQMKEGEPFDTGIQELFGSEFGYAGLQHKEHQVLSEMGYTFYDSDARRIYYYTGNANIKVISDDISKLFEHDEVVGLHMADDYYNNRVFICIQFSNGHIATLSYDFTAKCFISLHDFAFNWSFKTKTKCYFINKFDNVDPTDIYQVSNKVIADYPVDFRFNDTLYPTAENRNCIIDVIYNANYEVIKTCNVISWVCNKIKQVSREVNNSDIESLFVAEEYFEPMHKYKGEQLRLYTDCTATELIDISDRSNDHSIQITDSYKKPRYNLGKWTFNYFRNRRNANVDEYSRPADNQSLIYGKYIVARFVFDRITNFKIEDVNFTITNEYNV